MFLWRGTGILSHLSDLMTREKSAPANLSRSIIIDNYRVGFTSLKRHPWNRGRKTIGTRVFLAFAALFALLVVRTATPNFTKPLSVHHSSVNTVSSHTQRPHFDSDGWQWSAPVGHFLPFPPVSESAHLTAASQPWSALQTKGFHYNRPPPAI